MECGGVPQPGLHQTSPLSDWGLERGGRSLAELEKQLQIFPLGNPDNRNYRLFSTKRSPHVARHGCSTSIFRLRCCGSQPCLLFWGLVFGEAHCLHGDAWCWKVVPLSQSPAGMRSQGWTSMCFFWIGPRRLGWFNSPREAGFLTPGGQGRAQVPDQPPETVGTFILVSGKGVHSMGSEIRPPKIINWLHHLPAVWPWISQSLCASVSSIKSGKL